MRSTMEIQNQTDIVLDIETDGFDPSVIWCVVAKQGTAQTTFTQEQANEFQNYVSERAGATVYAHNGLCFDYPVLRRLWNTDFSGVVLGDTLVLSRLADPSRPGGHSLGAWGTTLGFPKGEHDEWHRYSPEMLAYCKQDVEVTQRLLSVVKRELTPKVLESDSVQLEYAVAQIIRKQIDTGWVLDERACMELLQELRWHKDEVELKVHERFRPLCTKVREIQPKVKKDGTLSVVGLKFLGEDCLSLVGGPLTRVDFPDFNLGSRQQIGNYLQRFGWVPRAFTDKGQPKVDETVLEHVKIPEARLIAEYLMLEKRAAMVSSWLDMVTEDGRVHGYVNPIGAVTGRMTHSSPNVAQVTANGKAYGSRMRDCWTVPRRFKLVGMDADGLELRMLAHYMNDDDYTQEVLHGDIHTKNQTAAGLPTRNDAKTFIYAFLYGAGDAKIGSIVGGSKAAGKRLKRDFLEATPVLKSLRDRVASAARRGWLQGLDGRRVHIRSEHAALNSLLQSAGAVVMKRALVILDGLATEAMLNYKFVGNIHDEIQTEVLEQHAEQFAKLAEESVRLAGEYYNMRIPLKGSATIGNTWKETH